MKDLGKIRERYDYSFDARQMGLVIFGVMAIAALVFVLGVSVGIQWQRKKQPEAAPQAKAQTQRNRKLQARAMPAAPPVLKPVTTSRAAFVPATTAPSVRPRTVTLTFPKVLTSKNDSVAPLVEKKDEKKKTENHAAQDIIPCSWGHTRTPPRPGRGEDAAEERVRRKGIRRIGQKRRL